LLLLQGHFTELIIKTTKRNEVLPGKVSVTPTSVLKPCRQAAPERQKWRRIPDDWWKAVPSTCNCHGKRTVAERVVGLTTRVGESADRRWRRLPSAKSNPNLTLTVLLHGIVGIQLNIVTCRIGIQRNSYVTMLLYSL